MRSWRTMAERAVGLSITPVTCGWWIVMDASVGVTRARASSATSRSSATARRILGATALSLPGRAGERARLSGEGGI